VIVTHVGLWKASRSSDSYHCSRIRMQQCKNVNSY